MPHFCFLTEAAHPTLHADDALVLPLLAAAGATYTEVPWEAVQAFDPATRYVFRNTWDYHRRPADFRAWLDHAATSGARLINPATLIHWNLHKGYLAQLHHAGVPIVPTQFVRPGEALPLAEVLRAQGWHRAVLKPAVSATARDTVVVTPENCVQHQPLYDRLLATDTVLVQPYVPEIETEGELSLIFLGGRYSHAVRKRPKAGDFRVQAEHGGSTEPYSPSPGLIAQAEAALVPCPTPPHYARVDGVVLGGTFCLMELELFEPVLFLGYHPEAPRRWAEVLLALA